MKYNILIYYILILLLFKISKSSVLLDENKLIQIKTSPKNYTLFSLKNIPNPTKLNIQIFLCQKTNITSHFSLLNGNNIIYETDIISSRQLIIPIENTKDLKINITSPGIFFNYQNKNESKKIFSLGIIKSIEIKNSNQYTLNMTPILINTSSKYEIYSLKENMTNQCEILEYINKNKPFYTETLNANGKNLIWKFSYKEKVDKYLLVKGSLIDFNYIHLYNIISLSTNQNNKKQKYLIVIIVIAIVFAIAIAIIIYCMKRNKENNSFNISGSEEPLINN